MSEEQQPTGTTPYAPAAEATALPPTIHEAELASGPYDAVLYGVEIDFDAAVRRRQAGEDVVIRGDDISANRRLANQIESVVGACFRQAPHTTHAGLLALPHFQQQPRLPPPPRGHTFYETDCRKAKRKP